LTQSLQAVSVNNRTITVFGRVYPVADDALITVPDNNNANLSNLKAGVRTGIGFTKTSQGLVVDNIAQF
jgi:hypothetical protein